MTAGLTDKGFIKATLDEIKTDIETVLQEEFGAINLSSSSVFTQIIGIFSEREALLWSALEAVYNSLYRDTATGSSLDGTCQLIGVVRLDATATIVTADVTGRNQTTITTLSEATALGINTTFLCKAPILLTNAACYSIVIEVTDTAKTDYIVTVNGTTYTYSPLVPQTASQIVDGLVTQLTAILHDFTAVKNDNLQLVITSPDLMSVYMSDGLDIENVTSKGLFYSGIKGAIALPANSLTTIQTPIAGWVSINNPLEGVIGRNLETDNELRIRADNSLKLAGSGTVDAIQARLANLVGVTNATVTENATDATVDTLTPHSFEALVLGGDNNKIALAIWNAKPAGIATIGDITENITDSAGRTQAIKFSRPTKYYITINIALTTTGLYPADGDDIIKAGIVKQINALNVHDTVIYQSLYQSVYSVAGITAAVITLGASEDPDAIPALASTNITTTTRQIPVTDITRITIA